MKSFASDNYAGVLPQVMNALMDANIDHAGSYGNAVSYTHLDVYKRQGNNFCGAYNYIFFIFCANEQQIVFLRDLHV